MSKEKWLRVHNTAEWLDYYTPGNKEDLRRFFDYYLKGVMNGWEETPRVRLSILDPGGKDIVNRPEKKWPLDRTTYQQLFLDAGTGTLSPKLTKKESLVRYRADDEKGQATLTIHFDKDIELTGFMKLHLWVEADGANDMDLFVFVQKLDAQGKLLKPSFNNRGPDGRLRVSHRQLDPNRSTQWFPYHTHISEELLSPGQIIPVDIAIRPIGMFWHTGQQLSLTIAGYNPVPSHLDYSPSFKLTTRNAGWHIIHTGEQYDSHLLIPVTSVNTT